MQSLLSCTLWVIGFLLMCAIINSKEMACNFIHFQGDFPMFLAPD